MSTTTSYLILASSGMLLRRGTFIYGLGKDSKDPEIQNIIKAISATDLTDFNFKTNNVAEYKGFQTSTLSDNHHLGSAYGCNKYPIYILNQLDNLGFQMISHTVDNRNMHYWHLKRLKS